MTSVPGIPVAAALVLVFPGSSGRLAAAQPDSVFTSSNLPIVVIDTHGQTIVDEPKITADMGIIDNGEGVRNYLTDPFNNYDGSIGIEIRGSSSQQFPKKQYGVETRDSAGADMNVSLLGLPDEADWVLSAPYSDKSLIRDALTYTLARQTGRYASRARFCEVVINGDYKGLYVLFEKIKRDKNRVNVSKMAVVDTAGDKLTGGYIVKMDKLDGSDTQGWYSGFPPYPGAWQQVYYQYHYPEYADLAPQQRAYIQRWMRDFEIAMELPTYADTALGYPHYIDVESFVDGILVSELGKNVDSYRLSTFFHKDRDSKGGKLVMGPLWDFNHAFGNSDYYDGALTDGWQLIYLATNQNFHAIDVWQGPFWWKKLFEETGFAVRMYDRWMALRSGVFSDAAIAATIDSLTGMLSEAQARNFDRWPILGMYVWPNAYVAQTYAEELEYVKHWVWDRLQWMDAALGMESVTPGEGTDGFPGQIVLDQNYPNPFNAGTEISYRLPSAAHIRLTVYDVLGREVRVLVDEHAAAGVHRARVDANGLASGVYLYRLNVRPDNAGVGFKNIESGSSLTKRLVLLR
jgi:hypothetical protein